MAAHKPAFKAFDMQALIYKINKSIVAPLPTIYSGAFRGLVKNMLRKNPELRPTAAELLNHPHLLPYILEIQLKLNSPRRSTFPFQWPESNYVRRTRFVEPESVSTPSGQDKHLPFGNDRALNPSISGTEQGSQCSTQRAHGFSSSKEKLDELSVSCIREECNTDKSKATEFSTIDRNERLRAAKDSATPRRQKTNPSKISNTCSKRDSLPASHSPPTCRASLPLPTRAMATATPYRTDVGIFRSVDSLDISVNAPQIDKIVEFPIAFCEDHFFPVRGTSSTSLKCSSSSPGSADCSITKHKCTIQVVDKASVPSSAHDACHGASGSMKVKPVVTSRYSAELHKRRFDTSSYQQRAEALEGLLEFSARLLQQQRFEELGVLLKPFGPEKVSPRETAIWLTKSFKETVV